MSPHGRAFYPLHSRKLLSYKDEVEDALGSAAQDVVPPPPKAAGDKDGRPPA